MASKRKETSGAKLDEADGILGVLTKEEKEALVNKKMEEMRRKNEALQRRHELIEADKKLAEAKGQAVNLKAVLEAGENVRPEGSKSPQAQNEPAKSKQPGRDSQPSDAPADHGNMKGVSSKEQTPRKIAVGRGKRLSHMAQQKLKAQDYEKSKKPVSPSEAEHNPPPDPGYKFLADSGREVSSQDAVETGSNPRRHPRNFGGASFDNVKNKLKAEKEKASRFRSGPPQTTREMELTMSGRERREYIDWRTEREQIDKARLSRHKNSEGMWKREWDVDKSDRAPTPSPPVSRKMEPGKRPAGRIGSGRFASGNEPEDQPKGQREEEPEVVMRNKGPRNMENRKSGEFSQDNRRSGEFTRDDRRSGEFTRDNRRSGEFTRDNRRSGEFTRDNRRSGEFTRDNRRSGEFSRQDNDNREFTRDNRRSGEFTRDNRRSGEFTRDNRRSGDFSRLDSDNRRRNRQSGDFSQHEIGNDDYSHFDKKRENRRSGEFHQHQGFPESQDSKRFRRSSQGSDDSSRHVAERNDSILIKIENTQSPTGGGWNIGRSSPNDGGRERGRGRGRGGRSRGRENYRRNDSYEGRSPDGPWRDHEENEGFHRNRSRQQHDNAGDHEDGRRKQPGDFGERNRGFYERGRGGFAGRGNRGSGDRGRGGGSRDQGRGGFGGSESGSRHGRGNEDNRRNAQQAKSKTVTFQTHPIIHTEELEWDLSTDLESLSHFPERPSHLPLGGDTWKEDNLNIWKMAAGNQASPEQIFQFTGKPHSAPEGKKGKGNPKASAEKRKGAATNEESVSTKEKVSSPAVTIPRKEERQTPPKEPEETGGFVDENGLPIDDDDEWEDDDHLHDSSAESLERFIQEHTLRLDIDEKTGDISLEGSVPSSGRGSQLTPASASSPDTPTSPDSIIKTPVGHVKVLDWGTEVDSFLNPKETQSQSPEGNTSHVTDTSLNISITSSDAPESPQKESVVSSPDGGGSSIEPVVGDEIKNEEPPLKIDDEVADAVERKDESFAPAEDDRVSEDLNPDNIQKDSEPNEKSEENQKISSDSCTDSDDVTLKSSDGQTNSEIISAEEEATSTDEKGVSIPETDHTLGKETDAKIMTPEVISSGVQVTDSPQTEETHDDVQTTAATDQSLFDNVLAEDATNIPAEESNKIPDVDSPDGSTSSPHTEEIPAEFSSGSSLDQSELSKTVENVASVAEITDTKSDQTQNISVDTLDSEKENKENSSVNTDIKQTMNEEDSDMITEDVENKEENTPSNERTESPVSEAVEEQHSDTKSIVDKNASADDPVENTQSKDKDGNSSDSESYEDAPSPSNEDSEVKSESIEEAADVPLGPTEGSPEP